MTKSRNINRPKAVWTEEKIAIVIARYPHEKTATIAADIGMTVAQVFGFAKRPGNNLKKTPEYLASPDACRLRRDNPNSIAHRFPKGHVPANKGLRRPGYAPGRMAETQFRKGSPPLNTKPVGAYRLDKDGVLQRKIGNAKGSNSKRWRGVHELIWIEAHGPVPEKHIVIFKPGMRTNVLEEITLEKVECISLAENMKRNTIHNYPKEIVEVTRLRAVITRKINRRTRDERTTEPAGTQK